MTTAMDLPLNAFADDCGRRRGGHRTEHLAAAEAFIEHAETPAT